MVDLFRDIVVEKKTVIREKPGDLEMSGIILRDERLRRFAGGMCLSGHPTPTLSSTQRCYVFVEPMYEGRYNEEQEILARGMRPRLQILNSNPILQFRVGLIQGYFRLISDEKRVVTFEVNADSGYYSTALYANDANFEAYNPYVGLLQSVGFDIKIATGA